MRTFFFARESLRPLAVVRIGLALALLWEAASLWPHAIEFYSTTGPALPVFLRSEIIPGEAPSPEGRLPRRYVGAFHPPVPSPLVAVILTTAHIGLLAAVALGWRTRTSLVLAAALSLGLGLLNGTMFAKYSVIALHALLLLACSRCGDVWSLDAWFRRRCRPEEAASCPVGAAWPRRLLQLLVCHVYLGAALTKLKTPAFFTGDLLEFSLLDDAWGSGRFGHWLSTQHNLVMLVGLATVFSELLFPFLVWVRRLRRPMLALAVLLHVGMGLLLHVGIFSPVMLAVLAAFLDESDLSLIRSAMRFVQRRKGLEPRMEHPGAPGNTEIRVSSVFHPWLRFLGSSAAYIIVLSLFVVGGTLWQWEQDWYGVFGRRVLPPPARLSPETVQEMLWPSKPAFEHYIHHVDLGSRANGNQVFGERRRFHPGDRVFVVTRLILPHPPITLEGLLLSPDGTEVARFTHRVDPSQSYSVNGFELHPSLPEGRYSVVLQVEGYQFARRDFELSK